MKTTHLKTQKPPAPLVLTDALDRQHRRVAKLARELNKARRRLERARVRLAVLLQLAGEAARRGLQSGMADPLARVDALKEPAEKPAKPGRRRGR